MQTRIILSKYVALGEDYLEKINRTKPTQSWVVQLAGRIKILPGVGMAVVHMLVVPRLLGSLD